MEDCVFLENPEEGEIFEESISDVLNDATTFVLYIKCTNYEMF